MNNNIVFVESDPVTKGVPAIVPLVYQAAMVLQDKISQVNALSLNRHSETAKKEDGMIPIWKRYSLSVPEAAKYFGIGEGRLYQIIAEHPKADFILEVGSHTKIKRVLFERFLDSASCV